MTLPADVSRCYGSRRSATGHERCTQRGHCRRYLELVEDSAPSSPAVDAVWVTPWVCDDDTYAQRIPLANVAEAA